MIERQKELLSYLSDLSKIYQDATNSSGDLLIGGQQKLKSAVKNVSSAIESGELLVPLIGGFSAGKSSALNTLLGENILPVAITQETAIPAELRYSATEYIIAVTTSGSEERYEITEIVELTKKAQSLSHLHMYLNRDVLKRVDPFILVDMPGFDSPVKSHNDSILRYLARGVHYLYLVDATGGTLKSDEVRRLNEIEAMGRDFNVFLTKKDLFSERDLQTVTEYIEDQVITQFDSDQPIVAIDKTSAEPLVESLLNVDPDKLFDNAYIGSVKEVFYSANSDLNAALSALKKSKSEKEETLNNLKRTLQNIKDKKEEMVSSSKVDESSTAKILRSLDGELRRSTEELSNSFNNSDLMTRKINDIVRSVMVRELKQVTQSMSDDISHSFISQSNINLNLDLNLDNGWLPNVIDGIRDNVMRSLIDVDKMKPSDSSGLGGVIVMIQKFIPHPVVKVVLSILPGIISSIFSSVSDTQKKEKVKESLRSQVFPDVLSQIEPELTKSLVGVQNAIAQSLSSEFEDKINRQQEILGQAEDEINSSDTTQKIDDVCKSISDLDVLTEAVLFKG